MEVDLARKVKKAFPSLELVRMVSSDTEVVGLRVKVKMPVLLKGYVFPTDNFLCYTTDTYFNLSF